MQGGQQDYRGLAWRHGVLVTQRLAGMLAPITFILPDGRQISPMQVAPWANEPDTGDLPGVLRGLRGDWACIPFGYPGNKDGMAPEWARLLASTPLDAEPHGHGSNHPWTFEDDEGTCQRLSIAYPSQSPIRGLRRVITPDPAGPAIDIDVTVETRAACDLPMGLHPTFRLPDRPGGLRIEPPPFREGRTFPSTFEPGAPLFAVNQTFSSLTAVPGLMGGVIDATRLPFSRRTEELLQLCDVEGELSLVNEAEGYRIRLTWQKEHFPSVLLWISNRGRGAAPWSGRHMALGVEPVCSAFDLGAAVATGRNPIAAGGTPTSRHFTAGEVFTTRYRIEAAPL